ncbi:hypothetical protein DL95DRAFT_152462 [Leptodontidium sp. 2 PMI_412]|nr:hypothetical protein DL95DRAFT_152462 [Leptodontidium sp. 2 PMI_412]
MATQLPAYHKFAIWECSLPPPRIIQAHLRRDGSTFFGNTAPPVALHICANSRKEAHVHSLFRRRSSFREV